MSGKSASELGLETLSVRLRNTLTYDEQDNGVSINKPDFRELDLGSPVSPLRTRPGNALASSSSSSSSSGSVPAKPGSIARTHSGELSVDSSPSKHGPNPNLPRNSNAKSHSGELSIDSSPSTFRRGHTRSYSTGSHCLSPVTSPSGTLLPTGNICPSGRAIKTGMASRPTRTDVLGSGSVNYGHGSIMRGGVALKPAVSDSSPKCSGNNDAEELKRMGNDSYKKGHFSEALRLYEKAISIAPGNGAYHFNRAAALMGLKRVVEAVKECEEAIRLEPGYVKAHHRLGSLLLSLGEVVDARKHICFPGNQPDPVELQRLVSVEKHVSKCSDARRVGDWRSTLREVDHAIASGARASPQLHASRAEALLKLHQLDDDDAVLAIDPPHSSSKIFGIPIEAYILFVRAQIDLSKGRFDSALAFIEKAGQIDPRNVEISNLLNNVKLVCRARARGNDLFKSERFTEACSAYGEGLRLHPSNSVLYCNRAACWFKLSRWEQSVHDCNQALRFQPNYIKALLRRAASNTKLERWCEAVRDYEVLRKELPDDNEVAESLSHAQVALKKEEVFNMKFVESISSLEQFRAAISLSGASVVHFEATSSNVQCKQISPFFNTLCTRYPSINFLKVDIENSRAIAESESVRIVPTVKIYKNGIRVKEMVCPSPEVLESSLRHYGI